jgi:hypothetical protein
VGKKKEHPNRRMADTFLRKWLYGSECKQISETYLPCSLLCGGMAFPRGLSCITSETFTLTRLNHVQPGFLRPFFRAAAHCCRNTIFHRENYAAFPRDVIPRARSPPSPIRKPSNKKPDWRKEK